MKKLYFLASLFLIVGMCVNAQTTNFVTGLSYPNDLAHKGNFLYVTELFDSKISKIDLTKSVPVAVPIYSIPGSYPTRMAINGNDLYFSDFAAGTISKIDLADSTQNATIVVDQLDTPNGLAINENDLYFTASNSVYRIDLTESIPTLVLVVAGLSSPERIAINGNDLYITERSGRKITKIDITAPTPTTTTTVVNGLDNPIGITIYGNDLYIIEIGGNKISKIDINAPTPTTTSLAVGGLTVPTAIQITDNNFYISQNGNKISTLNGFINSMHENLLETGIEVYPNPCKTHISLSNLKGNKNYVIYSVIGNQVRNGTISADEKISIGSLPSGIYFLKIENGTSAKFVKE
jgi:hypothetical protein